ncbi:MAG TPA: hypothetical protein VFD36_06805 [Kofleriaceae bacterium]|jgi:hypothetical protein|nr:hypothetical protein [Kofleriaceae bacterium]
MKKTLVKTKLVLHKETTRALLDKDLSRAGAGQGGGNDGTVYTQPNLGCLGADERK